ncbi:MAG: A/G-specific adenine glycosylase [Deltaproteobacteria bacterium]|nr:A/G-specific adenine glycosylase [Deltaproteobacteria bacterium]
MAPRAEIPAVREALLGWYREHRRDLPWRRSRDPYGVWVSEVMLQQTRVDTVVPYHRRFLERFPTVEALARAPEAEVLAVWSGLGYYRRARLLHQGARAVVERHAARVPDTFALLRALPGVGDYTAGAIGSIAYGLPVPVVDGNVERVLTRLHTLRGDPRASPGKSLLRALAARYAEHPAPGEVNQALMELGALVCAPSAPKCLLCPVKAHCGALAAGEPERYPEKRARAAPRPERWSALVATLDDKVWLVPSDLGRWTAMLLPPMVERDHTARQVVSSLGMSGIVRAVREAGAVTHVLTHASMRVKVFVGELLREPSRGELVARGALGGRAVPKVTLKVLEAALGVL